MQNEIILCLKKKRKEDVGKTEDQMIKEKNDIAAMKAMKIREKDGRRLVKKRNPKI